MMVIIGTEGRNDLVGENEHISSQHGWKMIRIKSNSKVTGTQRRIETETQNGHEKNSLSRKSYSMIGERRNVFVD